MDEPRPAYARQSPPAPPPGYMTHLPRDRYEELLLDLIGMHRTKSAAYGDALLAPAELGESPLLGVLIRMSDKWARIKNLWVAQRSAMGDEALIDTLKDLGAYAFLAVTLWEAGCRYGPTPTPPREEDTDADH